MCWFGHAATWTDRFIRVRSLVLPFPFIIFTCSRRNTRVLYFITWKHRVPFLYLRTRLQHAAAGRITEASRLLGLGYALVQTKSEADFQPIHILQCGSCSLNTFKAKKLDKRLGGGLRSLSAFNLSCDNLMLYLMFISFFII